MSEQLKKVSNPLFSAQVTGGTIEEFSQNAILLPAQEKLPPPPVPTHDQILSSIIPSKNLDNVTAERQIPLPPATVNDVSSTLQPQLWDTQPTSSLSSVFPSYPNLPIGTSNIPTNQQSTLSQSVGIDTSTEQLTPVPLFPAGSSVNVQPKPPTNTGHVNVFRRSGLKRPTYAPVPGLLNTVQAPVQSLPPQSHALFPDQQSSSTTYFTPKNIAAFPTDPVYPHFPPPPPQLSSPASGLSGTYSIPQPSLTFPPQLFGSTNFSSPVMDAIPASEALQNSDINLPSGDPSYMMNDSSANVNPTQSHVYRPVYHHWFFLKVIEDKPIWQPFSIIDSLALESAFTSSDLDTDKVIATDGGRYDVNILRRERTPVYWKGKPSEVRRCSWFHKGTQDGRLVPYEENVAIKLEDEYRQCFQSSNWHKKVELTNGDTVVFHAPDVLVLSPQSQSADAWGNVPSSTRPRVVKRGMDEFDIEEGEPVHVDHILFMVHGIGSFCDFKFRTVEEVVDEFRYIALHLTQSHYRSSCGVDKVHRVEVLPISWHEKLHSEETGIDNQLKGITLESIPKLRDFTNDTLLDILFYTSPIYCQNIISTVGNELNRVYDLFKQRNPTFEGGVSLCGHSLGSLILFDLLCHQHPKSEKEEDEDDAETHQMEGADDDIFPPKPYTKPPPAKRKMNRRISYMMGSVGTGQPQIHYPHLNFEPTTFFALGSPIGMFVIVRGLDTLGANFSLPTCPAFFNIFHPYDPIAYRMESLILPEVGKLKPVLIPHHKGRKRMHLELKDTMARVGADLKQKVVDSMKNTWNSFYQLAGFNKYDQPSLENEVQNAFQQQTENTQRLEEPEATPDYPLGNLNKGRRVDYVLQEAPFEFINEYIFALTSHLCYWESEDTVLLVLKEIYSSMGVTCDSQIPQQTMTIERPPPSPTSECQGRASLQDQDPTQQMLLKTHLSPPPISGFVRKT